MTAAAAASLRSVVRPATILRRAAAMAETRSASAPRLSSLRPSTPRRFLRRPTQATFCLESLLPLHNATATALMTSMLSISKSGFGFLPQGGSDDV